MQTRRRKKKIKAGSSYLQIIQPAVFKKFFVLCGGSLNYQFKNSINKDLQDSATAYISYIFVGSVADF